ncbi:MAG: ABC transporter permease [Chitinophagaceae bacterium]
MNKISLVFQREYLSRVKKKSFLLTTIIVPIVIVGFYIAIIMVSISGNTSTKKIAVIDEGGLFDGKIEANAKNNQLFMLINGETEKSFKSKYQKEDYNSFLYIPKLDYNDPKGIKLHSKSTVGLMDKSHIEGTIDRAIEKKRLSLSRIDPEIYKSIKSDISIDNALDSGTGEKKSVAGLAYGISFAAGFLIYFILMIYGMMVMRGVMEEKTNRIAEVIVSSVKPFQLMLGKILGIGAVGLTQFAIWIVLMGLLQSIIPMIFPEYFQQAQAGAGTIVASGPANMMATISEGLKSIPVALIVFCFVVYFIGGYLLYASLFAAVGSVVSEDQQEAQQLVFPILMPIILGFVIMVKAAGDPNSNLAVFGSIFPLTSPIVMMGRVTYGVPWWQLVISIVLLFATFLLFTWLTGKIYRTAILMYGKKVTWKEMAKWAFKKS